MTNTRETYTPTTTTPSIEEVHNKCKHFTSHLYKDVQQLPNCHKTIALCVLLCILDHYPTSRSALFIIDMYLN